MRLIKSDRSDHDNGDDRSGIEFLSGPQAGERGRPGSDVQSSVGLVALAPPAQQANAQVYLQLVADRVKLASQYNYVSVQQLPEDVRNKFIADHQSQQAQSNIFIDYATTTCNMG